MNFNTHSKLKDKHAFLSPSTYSWLNYSPDRLRESYVRYLAKTRGTELHALAAQCIRLGVKLPRSATTLNLYVNDAIGYRMTPEQTLYYSDNCFGTADAISFKKSMLRIHDLKTGETKVSMKQLLVYAALFCLEYGQTPSRIETELRIYQSNEVQIFNPTPEEILQVMDTIVSFDKEIDKLKLEG